LKTKISKVIKRDGRIVEFDQERITNAIRKAFKATKTKDGKVVKRISDEVVRVLEKKFAEEIPTVEAIQDTVEEVLFRNGLKKVVNAYVLYREEHRKLREKKGFIPVKELRFGVNAIKVLQKRYLLKDEDGYIIETPSQMFRRVASAVAKADRFYGLSDVKKTENEFYQAMINLEFLPNSPCLMNAGTSIGQLAACFVLKVEDSLKSIFTTLRDMALIMQSGGGVGYNFSKLRPKGDIVKSTKGVASGPCSFIRIFDVATEVIKSGGKRRGANMAVLNYDHPDILEFITAKTKSDEYFKNFNFSVGVTDKFMEYVEKNKEYWLVNPRNGEKVKKISARAVFDLIVKSAWQCGDPGLLFLDTINKSNPLPKLGRIESTNPCGEAPLLPYESCVLGSINLSKMVKNGKIDFKKLRKTVRIGVHFLDNVIDVNKYPLKEIEDTVKANRKIGLGVMGFADMLFKLGVPYNSKRAIAIAEKVMKFITKEARKKSVELGKDRGSFPNFKKSIFYRKYKSMRNATLTTIAPTGTISIIANCSSGIEPVFALSYIREVLEGARLLEVNEVFEKVAKKEGFYSEELMHKIAQTGSIQKIKSIPERIRRIFVTAFDIAPEWHVRIQAAFQKYTDQSVSKTINLPKKATIEDVRKVYLLAHKLKCKGITVYRYGSKKTQVLYISRRKLKASQEYAGGCVGCH